jgi:hypothetical protein
VDKIDEVTKFVDDNERNAEPALRTAVGAAATFAVITIAAAVGMENNDVQLQWIYVLISFLAPIRMISLYDPKGCTLSGYCKGDY